jgi:hypothetical protein
MNRAPRIRRNGTVEAPVDDDKTFKMIKMNQRVKQ